MPQTKTVYQADHDGWFVSQAVSHESPLEPGVFHLPAGCYEGPLPEQPWPEGHHPRWFVDRWVLADLPSTQPEEPEPPTPEQLQAQRIAAVQAHLDAQAQALGYDSIFTAVTYADEPAVPKFQAEGAALRAWRSLVWAACYQVLDDVLGGLRDIPSAEELISELPAFVPPEA